MVRGGVGRRRVVVTGMGCVSPLGDDAATTWKSASQGKSGAGRIASFDPADIPVQIAAECSEEIPLEGLPIKDTRRWDRCIQLAIQASLEAAAEAGWDRERLDSERTGVAIGTGIGGVGTLLSNHVVMNEKGPRRVSPFTVPMALANMPSGLVAVHFRARGPNITPVGACASGAQAIGEAMRLIERGDADVMIAGGTESVVQPFIISGFAAMKALSKRNDAPKLASRPFDTDRDGFLMGEGAAVFVLEGADIAKARGATPLAEVLGYGVAADAAHIALPAEDGAGARLAMTRCLADAELEVGDIDHINAHATSTPAGDQIEAAAIRALFGSHAETLPVSATKSMTGHLLGAAGAIEALFCVGAIRDGLLPPTINLDQVDPDCELDHVANKARAHDTAHAMSNAFGFGGINVSLILGRAAQ